MHLEDGWSIHEEQRTIVTLRRHGQFIRDENGIPKEYASIDEARYVAAHWDKFRAPTFEELRSMTDDELITRATKASI